MRRPTEPGLQVSVVPDTPFFPPSLLRTFLGYLMFLGTAGCVSTVVTPASPTVVPPPPTVEPKPVPATPSFPETPGLSELSHDVQWNVVTTDSLGTRRDTASHRARVSMHPRRDNRGGLEVEAISTRVSGDSSIVDTLPPISVAMAGSSFQTTGPTCGKTTGREISPLLLRPLVLRSSSAWPAVDSLAYRTCVSGVVSTVRSEVTWTEPRVVDGQFEQSIRVSGVVHSDSSRTLPMRVVGQIDGSVTLLIDPVIKSVRSFSGSTTTHLVATANRLRQVVDQVVTFRGDLVNAPR